MRAWDAPIPKKKLHNEDIHSVEYKGCFMVDLTAASQEFGGWRTFWFVIAEACPVASREAITIADRDVVSWIGEKVEVDQVAELSRQTEEVENARRLYYSLSDGL